MADQVKYTQKLKGDKVLVIGGSSGIGFGVAEACLENGCKVTISSSNPDRVQSTVSKLQDSYPSAASSISGYACDLSDQAHLSGNVEALFEKVGTGIDHVVYTAGDSLAVMPLEDLQMEGLLAAGCVRFFAPLFVAKVAVKYMTKGPKSSITLTTGAVSERPRPNWSVINSFATGLQGVTRGLALDLKPIRVNLVSPGVVDTNLWAGMSAEQKQKMFEEMEQHLPVGKVGTIEDVAESYLYLMKDRNVTGSMVSTSGGHLLV